MDEAAADTDSDDEDVFEDWRLRRRRERRGGRSILRSLETSLARRRWRMRYCDIVRETLPAWYCSESCWTGERSCWLTWSWWGTWEESQRVWS